MVFKCHNCGVGRTLPNFLKDQAPDLYDEIQKDVFLTEETNPWLAHAYGPYVEDTISFADRLRGPYDTVEFKDTITFEKPEPDECGWDPTTGPTC